LGHTIFNGPFAAVAVVCLTNGHTFVKCHSDAGHVLFGRRLTREGKRSKRV